MSIWLDVPKNSRLSVNKSEPRITRSGGALWFSVGLDYPGLPPAFASDVVQYGRHNIKVRRQKDGSKYIVFIPTPTGEWDSTYYSSGSRNVGRRFHAYLPAGLGVEKGDTVVVLGAASDHGIPYGENTLLVKITKGSEEKKDE